MVMPMPHSDDHDDEHDHIHPPPPLELPEAEANGFGVTSTTNGNQNSGVISSLTGGNFVISFLSSSTADDGQDIRARFFRLDGSAIGPDIRVNETTAGTQTGISSLALNDGSVLITWRSPDPANSGNSHLFGRRFSADGVALTGEVQLSASGADGSYNFTQRSGNTGSIIVAYQNDGEIFGRSVDPATLAARTTSEVQLNTTLTGTPESIGFQSLSNNNLVLRFESPEGGANGTEIRNRVFSVGTNGELTPVTIGSSNQDFLVNTTSTGNQTGVRVSRLADSRVLEVWQSTDTGDGSGTTIRARYVGSDGAPSSLNQDFVFNTTTANDQRSPSILNFTDWRRLVWWHSFDEGSTDTIRGRWVEPNGTLGASDFVITRLPDTAVPSFTLVRLADDSVAAVYGGTAATDGSGTGIQAVRMMNLGGSLFPSPGAPNELTLPPIMASPFDDSLPEYDWTAAAAQISRNITSTNPGFTNGLGNPLTITFAFRDTTNGMPSMETGASGFSRFTDAQISAALYAMQQWQDVANITLTRVQDENSQYSNNAQFTLWNYTAATSGSGPANAAGYGFWRVNNGVAQNYVYLNQQKTIATAPTSENGGLEFYMHEIGHALGLSHPGQYNVGGSGTYTAYAQNAIFFEDSEQYSVMSYFEEQATHAFYGANGPVTPMLYDIAAIQRLYGANMTTRTGDNVYGFNANAGQAFLISSANQQTVFSVWDAGGRDVFDFSGYDKTQWINLNEEAFSSVGGLRNNISIARNVTIEDAYGGSGADSMLGSAVANLLRGNAGADSLDGGSGNDTLEGGAGNDFYIGVTGDDRISEAAGGGADTIIANSSILLPDNIEVAVIAPGAVSVSLSGGAAHDMIMGNELRNIISGAAGNDTLNGQGGDDEIFGGEGNDLLIAGAGARYLDGGAGDDVILVGNTDLAAIMALFSLP